MAPSPKEDRQPAPGRLLGFRAAQDSRRLCGAAPAAPFGHDTSFHEGLRRGECGAPACAALPLSPASALRSPVFISHVWLASHQEFRLNAFQVMEEGADPGGLRRRGPELTLMPSPLTTCWARGGTHGPTASASSQNPQTPHSWCKPLPFLKKDLFLLLIYCFWHLGKPSSSHSSHSRHGVLGGERLPCPGPREARSLYRGHTPGHFPFGMDRPRKP